MKLSKILVAGLIAISVFFNFSCKEKEVKTTVIGYRTGSLCAIPMHIAVLNSVLDAVGVVPSVV